VQVRAFQDDDVYVLNILRSHHTKKPLAILPGRSARTTLQFRPVHCDVLRYEAAIGRLRITTRAASMVDFYRAAIGKVLFNDESFFDGAPVYDLRVLQERGRGALEQHSIMGIGRTWMTECLWERGDRNLHYIRSNDCFRSIEELNLPLTEGKLLQAKLKVQVIGKSTRPVTVNIRVPSRIEVSQKSREQVVERLLKEVGIINPRRTPQRADFWSLYPWRHPIRVWRDVFGPDLDTLVRIGVLSTTRLDSVPHPDHGDAGNSLQVHEVSNGDYYGVSRLSEISARSLTATDIDGLELVPEQFRRQLQARLGISGGKSWKSGELLDLGLLDIGGKSFYLFYALREPSAGIGQMITAQAAGVPAVILMPTSQGGTGSELCLVLLDIVLPTPAFVKRAIIAMHGLADTLPALYSAPDGARLIVDTKFKKIWVDGVEITGLLSDSQPFRFIELMSKSFERISTDALSSQLSPGRIDGNTTARQAKTAAKRAIAEAMASAGRTFEGDPFPSAGNGFYRSALTAYVR
jgi:hypothetical protein